MFYEVLTLPVDSNLWHLYYSKYILYQQRRNNKLRIALLEEVQLVVQLVEARCFEPEGGMFDSRWCHWNFLLTLSFRPHYDLGVDSVSKRNEYQEYFLERSVRRANNLTTFLCRLSRSPGASTCWNGLGLY
jgi:hypothetical protein